MNINNNEYIYIMYKSIKLNVSLLYINLKFYRLFLSLLLL